MPADAPDFAAQLTGLVDRINRLHPDATPANGIDRDLARLSDARRARALRLSVDQDAAVDTGPAGYGERGAQEPTRQG